MLHNFFIILSSLSQLFLYVDAAAYIIPPEKLVPAKYACRTGCYVKDLDKWLPYDKPYSPKDGKSCLQYTCSKEDNNTSVNSCGALGYSKPCEKVPGNLFLEYPHCCDSVRCPAVDPVTDPEPKPCDNETPRKPVRGILRPPPETVETTPPVDTDTSDPVSNNPDAEPSSDETNTNPIEPKKDATPIKKPVPVRPRPIRPGPPIRRPICPQYSLMSDDANKVPVGCKHIKPEPLYSTQPVPATTI